MLRDNATESAATSCLKAITDEGRVVYKRQWCLGEYSKTRWPFYTVLLRYGPFWRSRVSSCKELDVTNGRGRILDVVGTVSVPMNVRTS